MMIIRMKTIYLSSIYEIYIYSNVYQCHSLQLAKTPSPTPVYRLLFTISTIRSQRMPSIQTIADVLSYRLKLIKMRAKLASLKHYAVPFLSRASAKYIGMLDLLDDVSPLRLGIETSGLLVSMLSDWALSIYVTEDADVSAPVFYIYV